MLSFKQAIITCVREKPLNIKDRAPRSEFWWFMLALFIVGIIANILALIPVLGLIIYIVYSIASLVLTITVSVRRLHDRNMRGWWLVAPYVVVFLGVIVAVAGGIANSEGLAGAGTLIAGIGCLGFIALFVLYCLPGTKGPNRFGPDPIDTMAQFAPQGMAPMQPQAPYGQPQGGAPMQPQAPYGQPQGGAPMQPQAPYGQPQGAAPMQPQQPMAPQQPAAPQQPNNGQNQQ